MSNKQKLPENFFPKNVWGFEIATLNDALLNNKSRQRQKIKFSALCTIKMFIKIIFQPNAWEL